MKKSVRVYVFGIVQGIFFRAFVKEKAEELNIRGYVRNKDDGSVEIWIEGNNEDVDKMVDICKQGPPHAVINRFDILGEKFHGFEEFKILSI